MVSPKKWKLIIAVFLVKCRGSMYGKFIRDTLPCEVNRPTKPKKWLLDQRRNSTNTCCLNGDDSTDMTSVCIWHSMKWDSCVPIQFCDRSFWRLKMLWYTLADKIFLTEVSPYSWQLFIDSRWLARFLEPSVARKDGRKSMSKILSPGFSPKGFHSTGWNNTWKMGLVDCLWKILLPRPIPIPDFREKTLKFHHLGRRGSHKSREPTLSGFSRLLEPTGWPLNLKHDSPFQLRLRVLLGKSSSTTNSMGHNFPNFPWRMLSIPSSLS